MKDKGKTFLLLRLAMATVVLLGTSFARAGEKLKIGTALKEHPVFALPMLAAQEKGFWTQQSLEAEWIPFRGSAAMHAAQAAGAVQMGIDAVASAVPAIARGVPIIIVSHLGVSDMFGIWVRTGSPVHTPRELRGKKIDVSRLGGSSHAFAQAVTRSLGMEREVKFTASGGTLEMVAVLKASGTDSVMMTFFAIAPLWAAGEAREILKVEDYLPRPWINRVVQSRKDFLAKQPKEVEKTVRALLVATDFIMKNKDWAVARMQSFSRYTPAVAEAIYPMLKFSPDGRLDKQGLGNVRQFLLDYGIMKQEKAPALEDLYTSRFTG